MFVVVITPPTGNSEPWLAPRTKVFNPSRAEYIAAAKPTPPAPMIITSKLFMPFLRVFMPFMPLPGVFLGLFLKVFLVILFIRLNLFQLQSFFKFGFIKTKD